jgi:hypothetical protein
MSFNGQMEFEVKFVGYKEFLVNSHSTHMGNNVLDQTIIQSNAI